MVGEMAFQAKREEQRHNLRLQDEASAFHLRLEWVRHMRRIKLRMFMTADPLQSRTLEAKVETAVKRKPGAADVAQTLPLIPPEAGDNPVVDSRLSTVGLGAMASIEGVATPAA
jgi:hypothetical protein